MLGTGAGKFACGEASVVDEDVEATVLRVEVVVGGLMIGRVGDVEFETSASTPAARSFARASSPCFWSREPITTFVSGDLRSSAVWKPRPRFPPVMKATF
jgi:hypothetical protein